MHTTKYLIVGAGMTGDMAAKGIREHDSDGSITMIGADPHPTYKRPLLTKGLWQGAPEEKLWREAAEGVELVTGRRIVSLDLAAHTAADDTGEEYSWEKLLLATGAKPREIPGAEGVIWYRTLDDYRRLRESAPEGSHVVVIGGGFIGSEIAAGLVGNGCRVTMLFPEPGIGFRLFPEGLSTFVADYYREYTHHGGITSEFMPSWMPYQVATVQHGRGEGAPVNPVNGRRVTGPETVDEAERAKKLIEIGGVLNAHPLCDTYYRDRSADLSKITVPTLSSANWGGMGLHSRGNFEAFTEVASDQKWLEVHGLEHWTEFYTDYGVDVQRR